MEFNYVLATQNRISTKLASSKNNLFKKKLAKEYGDEEGMVVSPKEFKNVHEAIIWYKKQHFQSTENLISLIEEELEDGDLRALWMGNILYLY